MIWLDYTVHSYPNGDFTVEGEWPGEVMGINKDGSRKDYALYKPGDVFIVDENGILRKTDNLSALVLHYDANKKVDN